MDSAKKSIKKENSFISDEEVDLHGYDVLSKYYTLIAMRQDRAKSFADSEKENHMHTNNNRTVEEKQKIIDKFSSTDSVTIENHAIEEPRKKEKKIVSNSDDFEITKEIIDLFGEGYTKSIYKKMFDKYEKLKLNYSLQTNLHQEALATYVRFKVQEEIATSEGNVVEAKKWYEAATDAADKAKLTPKQLTKADLQGGVSSISELVKALEQAVDVVKILPQFKYRPNDAPDFNIWCYVNYERELNGQPSVCYEDIYSFYDKKKKEFLQQNGDPYGIFDEDTTIKNREIVKTFIKLPEDYDDLAGDKNE